MNDVWSAPRVTGRIRATVCLPGSKSLSARQLLLSAIAESAGQCTGLLWARDTDLMVQALRQLGAEISPWPPVENQPVQIRPIPRPANATASKDKDSKDKDSFESAHRVPTIECGLAGTVMRFLPALALACQRPLRFTADSAANQRPLRPLLEALESLGATWISEKPAEGIFPFTIYPPQTISHREVCVDASASSQFISALLLVAARLPEGLIIRSLTAEVPSRPHLLMTLECLQSRGISANEAASGTEFPAWKVDAGSILAREIVIEPDLSNAGPFLALAGIAGGSITVANWPHHTTQAGDAWRWILPEFAMKVVWDESGLTASAMTQLRPVDLDLKEVGELAPTVAALAAFAPGVSCLRGLHHLRGHETDRLAAIRTELQKLGIPCQITDSDDLMITGVPPSQIPAQCAAAPVELSAWGDHRMASFAALLGLHYAVTVDDIGATSKTLPEFARMWQNLLNPPNFSTAEEAYGQT